MNPRDEGLYAWFTVNFLLDIFSSGSLDKSFVALDRGGGSTQVTDPANSIPLEVYVWFLGPEEVLG